MKTNPVSTIFIFQLIIILFISCEENAFTIPFHDGIVKLDGSKHDSIWKLCQPYEQFYYPPNETKSQRTEFRSFWNKDYLYFHFDIIDRNVVCDNDREKSIAVEYSDRAEIFFAIDDQLSEYFGLEIDACERMINFKSVGYRNFEPDWTFPYLRRKDYQVKRLKSGYQVEGRIEIKALSQLGILKDQKLLMGVFQADFRKANSRKSVQWKSWNEIRSEKPDFHTLDGFQLVILGD